MAKANRTEQSSAVAAGRNVMGMIDEIDRAVQKTRLVIWIEGARKALADLQAGFAADGALRSHYMLAEIRMPDWMEAESDALQNLSIEGCAALVKAEETITLLSGAPRAGGV